MKPVISALLATGLAMGAAAGEKRSLLNSDPEVVYLDQAVDKPVELLVIKEAPVFSDRDGRRQLGTVVSDQKVILQAMDERAYKVSARTTGNKVTGWVAPWAFAAKDPQFVDNLKKLYDRQLEVSRMIRNGEVAVGMTMDEVGKSLGEPTKTTVRKTGKGRSGSWEYIAYEEIPHYNYVRDPRTGQVFRQFSYNERIERGKRVVEFEDEVVTAIEESESDTGGDRVKIVVPPLIFGW